MLSSILTLVRQGEVQVIVTFVRVLGDGGREITGGGSTIRWNRGQRWVLGWAPALHDSSMSTGCPVVVVRVSYIVARWYFQHLDSIVCLCRLGAEAQQALQTPRQPRAGRTNSRTRIKMYRANGIGKGNSAFSR